mmetsp:Transcript_20186/g.43594  ORF Transcript_20186/g.43594 Transcript_20186/m.43594 type:complete len:234 (+) Transcript_20186:591-1292(+)
MADTLIMYRSGRVLGSPTVMSGLSRELSKKGAMALTTMHSKISGVETCSILSSHELVLRKSNCCPFTSEMPGGSTLSSTPASSGKRIICDMAAECDNPVDSNGVSSCLDFTVTTSPIATSPSPSSSMVTLDDGAAVAAAEVSGEAVDTLVVEFVAAAGDDAGRCSTGGRLLLKFPPPPPPLACNRPAAPPPPPPSFIKSLRRNRSNCRQPPRIPWCTSSALSHKVCSRCTNGA